MMKSLSTISVFTAVAVLLTVFPSRGVADHSFAAGSAQISVPCKIEFSAFSTGGNVTEQCDFGNGQVLFHGPVLCFAASGNVATFVWQMQIAPPAQQGMYQQVFIVDNGAPGQGVPDAFLNYPESPINACPSITPDSTGTNPVLNGNFVVNSGE